MSSCPGTAPRRRLWLAVSLVPLLLAASCTGPGAAASRAPAARAPAARAPVPVPLASFAPFTSKLRVPGFSGGCPATAAPRPSGRTVVIPLRILTPSPVISQIFAGVCLNGHGPYPFIVDTGSSRTIVDAALARRLGLVSASAASGMRACGGTARDATVRLSAGPFAFGQDRQVLITGLASPSAPLMGILGADPLDERWESHDETSAALAAVDVLVHAEVQRREDARARRDWAEADAIRDRLKEAGIEVTDTGDGPQWSLLDGYTK